MSNRTTTDSVQLYTRNTSLQQQRTSQIQNHFQKSQCLIISKIPTRASLTVGPNRAKVQDKVQLLHTDGSISDKAIRKSDPYITVSCSYVAPVHSTCEVLDDIKNVDVSHSYNQHEGQKLLSETKESTITTSEERKATFAMSLRLSKKELLVRTVGNIRLNSQHFYV